jgi:hypothetical protein
MLTRRTDKSGPAEELLEMISAMARPGELAELLRSISKDDRAIYTCAKRSFRHPLGFDKLTIIDALPLFVLRVHAWWPGAENSVDHVHNHRFSFVSSVVSGSYDMQIYEKDPNGSPVVEYEEEVSSEQGWRLQRVATTRIRSLSTIRLQQGASYALPAETLHRVAVKQEAPCVTLLLQTKISRSTTQVFIRQDDPIPVSTPKEPFSYEHYQKQIEWIMQALPFGFNGFQSN